jgi:trehalose 6-phosphate synthase
MSTVRRRTSKKASFVVVANRLPVDRFENPDGSVEWRTSPGGLVTAFEPVMRTHRGAWVGWPGSPDDDIEPFTHNDLQLEPVHLTADDVELYYEGFSNGTLWPLYHDVVAPPAYHREWWDRYVTVNERFAEAAARVADEGGQVWIQDYQLQLVPQLLRQLRPDLRIGFFLHIPFPPTELFQQLPWRSQILQRLLGADLVGFQLPGGAQNFVRLVRQRFSYETRRDRIRTPDGRTVIARAYPIAIDSRSMHELAMADATAERAREIRADLGDPKTIFLGVDRLVGRINGDTGLLGRPPIIYLHNSYPREEMAAMYRAADVMVVTPLRDGMNLVAKEYVACRDGDNGALVLSEFTGAAKELRQAYLVNPHDIDGLKATMVAAAEDSARNKARRMRIMRRHVFDHDIDHWAGQFLDDLSKLGPGSEY